MCNCDNDNRSITKKMLDEQDAAIDSTMGNLFALGVVCVIIWGGVELYNAIAGLF